MRNDVAVRSIAGSVVVKDCTLSWYTAFCDGSNAPGLPLNFWKVSFPSAGHRFIPSSVPEVAESDGPSEAAPQSTGVPPEVPSSEPAMFATWCWMQFGKVLPSPTMNEEPHAFAPRMLPSHLCE